MIRGGRRRRRGDSFGFPLQGQAVVQLGDFGLIGFHHQRPIGVEEFGDGFGELGFSLLLGFPADESQLQGVFVIEPAGGAGRIQRIGGFWPKSEVKPTGKPCFGHGEIPRRGPSTQHGL